MNVMFKDAKAFSYYPKSWDIPEDKSEDMFTGTPLEADAKKKTDAADGIGFITITAESEAMVYVDPKLVSDKSPVTKHEVTSGTHTVRVYFPDTKKFSNSREIHVDKDATMSVHFTKE